jgi:hypothetical protein
MTIKREVFLREFMPKIESNEAAFFIGAGFSQSVGYANWKELLRDLAKEINLDVERETDLISLAQYYENHRGSRSKINEVLIEKYSSDAKPHLNHTLLAQLPVHTVWTTNYDHLLEDAYRSIRKRVDIKSREPNLTQSKPGRDVTIFKMHGDIDQPQEAVLTRHDYDLFHHTRSLFSEALKGDFINKTFLFLGFSFTDPNIDYVLSRIHVLLGKDMRAHYCIMRYPEKPKKLTGRAKVEYEYECHKLDHRIIDLKRYDIHVVLIDDYKEITEILTELNTRVHHKNVFVSGSAYTSDPLGQQKFDELCTELGREIIKNGYNLTSGFGKGVGAQVLAGALEEVYSGEDAINERISLFPFPRKVPAKERAATHARYRQDMQSTARYCIFISGNRMTDGKIIQGPGVQEEFDMCIANKRIPIPIGATGHSALRFWELVSADPKKYFGNDNREIRATLKFLGDSDRSPKDLVSDVFKLIGLLTKG